MLDWGSWGDAAVRAPASHQCGLGSINSRCRCHTCTWVESVVDSCPYSEMFTLGFLVFLPSHKPTFPDSNTLSYLPTLPVLPGVSKVFIKSPGLPVRLPNLPGNSYHGVFQWFFSLMSLFSWWSGCNVLIWGVLDLTTFFLKEWNRYICDWYSIVIARWVPFKIPRHLQIFVLRGLTGMLCGSDWNSHKLIYLTCAFNVMIIQISQMSTYMYLSFIILPPGFRRERIFILCRAGPWTSSLPCKLICAIILQLL